MFSKLILILSLRLLQIELINEKVTSYSSLPWKLKEFCILDYLVSLSGVQLCTYSLLSYFYCSECVTLVWGCNMSVICLPLPE